MAGLLSVSDRLFTAQAAPRLSRRRDRSAEPLRAGRHAPAGTRVSLRQHPRFGRRPAVRDGAGRLRRRGDARRKPPRSGQRKLLPLHRGAWRVTGADQNAIRDGNAIGRMPAIFGPARDNFSPLPRHSLTAWSNPSTSPNISGSRSRDGTRLAARLWLPGDAATTPVPAILEYIPYRKRDGTRGRDEPMHGYFAAQGYAAIRVDMRGSGESDGLLDDEYLQQEQDDALEVIAWIAAQPWCSGAVGMMGKSWGGFNCLQVAARRPPALKGHHHGLLDRRPLRRRHPLHGREPAQRQSVVGRPSCWPTSPGRRIRSSSAPAGGTAWIERLAHMPFWPGAVAAAPAARRLLATRLGLRGLRRDRLPGVRDRRLGRRLYQRGAAPARKSRPSRGSD